jgi:acetyl esterase/lipase
MIVGNFGLFDAPLSRYVSASGVPMLSVDYRVAPEHPHSVPVEDSYAGSRWLSDHADELGRVL